MKAAVYNPYLDTLGGGERYTTAFVQSLVRCGYRVDVEWKDSGIRKKLEERFGIKLDGVDFVKDIKRADGYEISFWVSDGSIPLLRARRNFLHFQFPFRGVNGKSLLNRMKFFRIEKNICNSMFTKRVIDDEYGIKSVVLYPPVDTLKIKPKKKENIILSTGRFSQLTQAKRQDILISAFKSLYKKGFKEWKLILAGGSEVGGREYVEKLKKMSHGFPIVIKENLSFKDLLLLYGMAKIFWSASGFGQDEEKEPKKVEHFGITTVEAMAAGCVPLTVDKGGFKEVIKEGKNGFLWSTKWELVQKTASLIENRLVFTNLSKMAVNDSKFYGYDKFHERVEKLIQ